MKKKHLLLCICSGVYILGLIGFSIFVAEQIATLEQEKQSAVQALAAKEQENQAQSLLIGELKGTIETLETEVKSMEDNFVHLESDLKRLKDELKKEKEVAVSRNDSPTTSVKEFYVTATAYTPYCAGCSGITATGINVRKNPNMKLIAVDPSVIPLGTKVWVEGYGYAITGDTGGAIKGNKIDLLMPTKQEANKWGRKKVLIKVFKT